MRWMRKKFWLALCHAFNRLKWQRAEEYCNSRYCVAIGMDANTWKYL